MNGNLQKSQKTYPKWRANDENCAQQISFPFIDKHFSTVDVCIGAKSLD